MVWVVNLLAPPAGALPGYSAYRLRIWLEIALIRSEIAAGCSGRFLAVALIIVAMIIAVHRPRQLQASACFAMPGDPLCPNI